MMDDDVERRYAEARQSACDSGNHYFRRDLDDVWRCATSGCGVVSPVQPGARPALEMDAR